MGTKEMILLFIVLLEFSSPASLIPLSKNMVSIPEHLQKNTRDEGMEEHSSVRNGAKSGGIVPDNKFAHGSGGHGEGGHSVGTGQNGNGGQSNSPHTQGGSTPTVIPVYAAGAGAAAGRHNNHHNAGTCSHCRTGLPTLAAGVLVCSLIHIWVVLEF